MPIHLKRLDGTVTRYRNAEYIPAYLFLPESVLNRCPQELHLQRTVFSFFHDRDVIRVVESNLFIELMMDAYAFLVWPHLGVRGYMESYSGYDPVYIIAHSPCFWVQELTDERILPTVEDLFRSGQAETMAYPSEAVVSDYLAQIIPAAMGKYNLDVVIETAKAMRCPEDFDFRQSGVKIDFFRQWYHTRTQRTEFSLEAYNEAAEAGLDCSKYIRSVINAVELERTPQSGFSDRAQSLIRIGRRFNDILVRARTLGFLDAPALRAALDEYHAVLEEIYLPFRRYEGHEEKDP